MKSLFVLLTFISSLAFGQKRNPRLFEFKASACDRYEDTGRLRTRIVSKIFSKDTLTVVIASTATCSKDFIPKIKVSRDSIRLDFDQAGEYECFCCYEFTYRILNIKNQNSKILFRGEEVEQSSEKYKTYPVKFEIVNGDTLNYVDKYGRRQGKFIRGLYPLSFVYNVFLDDINIKIVELYPNGDQKSIASREKMRKVSGDGSIVIDYTNFNHYIEYFPSGKKKRECFSLSITDYSRDSYQDGVCKEWDEEQILIYTGPYKKEK